MGLKKEMKKLKKEAQEMLFEVYVINKFGKKKGEILCKIIPDKLKRKMVKEGIENFKDELKDKLKDML